MPDLYERIEMRRWRRIRSEALMRAIRRQLLRLCASLVVVTMLFAVINLPVIYAYFTAHMVSDPLDIAIVPPERDSQSTDAYLHFLQPFLFTTSSSEGSDGDETPALMVAGDTGGDAGVSVELAYDVLQVSLQLDSDFSVGELYPPSITLVYGNQSLPALDFSLEGDEAVVSFAADEVAGWADELMGKEERITVEVAGEGYVGGLDHFAFRGEASIDLHGLHEVMSVRIDGPEELEIPTDDEVREVRYQLVDQGGSAVRPVTWSASSLPEGVQFSSGVLRFDADSAAGTFRLEASTEQEYGRVLTAAAQIHLQAPLPDDDDLPLPGYGVSEIHGPALILIPEDDVVSEVPYRLSVNGESVSATWEMAESSGGVSMSRDGVLQVDGGAAPGELEILAIWVVGTDEEDGEILQEASHTVELAHPEPSEISLGAPAEILIPAADDGKEVIAAYALEVTVRDQKGNVLPDARVLLSIDDSPGGVQLNADADELLVSSEARAGTVRLTAASVHDAEVVAKCEIELVSRGEDGESGDDYDPGDARGDDKGSDPDPGDDDADADDRADDGKNDDPVRREEDDGELGGDEGEDTNGDGNDEGPDPDPENPAVELPDDGEAEDDPDDGKQNDDPEEQDGE